jgi:hypothetical protein
MRPQPTFFETLEDQVWHAGVEGLGLDVELDRQTVGESRLLDLEILAEELELLLEPHFVAADLLEREAEQIAQARERAVGLLDVLVHQRRDGVQRVEEEVRVELLLQRRELRFDQPGLELRRSTGRRGSDRRSPSR